jgi:hypothetical protein
MNDRTGRLVTLFASKLPYLLLDRDAPGREERSLLEALLRGRNPGTVEAVWEQLSCVWQSDPSLRQAVLEVCEHPGDPSAHERLDRAFAAALDSHTAQRDLLDELVASPTAGTSAADRPGMVGRLASGVAGRDWYGKVLEGGLGLFMIILVVVALGAVEAFDDDLELTILRGFAIVLLATLPGLLYFRFLGFRAFSLWNEFSLNLHRLGMDEPQYLPRPPATSTYFLEWRRLGGDRLEGLPNLYKEKFQAYYGRGAGDHEADNAKAAKASGFPPVLVATTVFAAGWTALLGHSPIYSASRMTIRDVLGFGFAGAYVFILQMLMRRYFQSDLKPSAYIGAVVRVITVLIVVLVVHRAWLDGQPPGQEAAVAFIIGFFPLMGIQFLQRLATLALRYTVPSLKNAYPLSDLDGLNIWYEARLLEEGIEDMQNLSTANLVDVILHTRVPVGRLVDWVDQAVLYLHLELPRQQRERARNGDAVVSSRDRLRRLGIRSATGLEDAFRRDPAEWAASDRRELLDGQENVDLVEGLRWALNPPRTDGKPDHPSVTQTIVKALRDQPNLTHVRHWKSPWRAARPTSHLPVAVAPPSGPLVATAVSRTKPPGQRHPNGRSPAGAGRSR